MKYIYIYIYIIHFLIFFIRIFISIYIYTYKYSDVLKRPSHGVRENNDEALKILRSLEPGRASVASADDHSAIIFLIFCTIFCHLIYRSVVDLSDWCQSTILCTLRCHHRTRKRSNVTTKKPWSPKEREYASRSLFTLTVSFFVWARIAAAVSLYIGIPRGRQVAENIPRRNFGLEEAPGAKSSHPEE